MKRSGLLDRPVTSIMAILSLTLLGAYSVSKMEISLLPSRNERGATVITRFPGATPKAIERSITKPLENSISKVSGISNIFSISKENESRINLRFHKNAPVHKLLPKLQERIEEVILKFPREVEKPYLIPLNDSERPIFILSLTSSRYSLPRLRRIAENLLKPQISRISGVSEVFISGGSIRELHVDIDPVQLNNFNLTPETLAGLIDKSNFFMPVGIISDGKIETKVQVPSRARSLIDIQNVAIPFSESNIIQLGSVFRVQDSYREKETISRTNRKEHVSLYVMRSSSGNIVQIGTEIVKLIQRIDIPKVQLASDYNAAVMIQSAINNVIFSLLLGIVISGLVVFFFLKDLVKSIIVALLIPACVLTSFFFMYLFHLRVNVMTLVGLAIATGMLIDNAIVVIEMINQKESELTSHTPRHVIYTQALKAVLFELIAATSTSIIVFLPVLYAQEKIKNQYSDLFLSISLSLVIALGFSIFFLPSILLNYANFSSSHGMRIKGLNQKFRVKERARWISDLTNGIMERSIRFLQEHRQAAWGMMIMILILGGFSWAFSKKNLFLSMQEATIHATVEIDIGTNLEETANIVEKIENIIMQYPAVLKVNSKITKWHADLIIKLKHDSIKETETIINQLQASLRTVQHAFITMDTGNTSAEGQYIDINIFGPELPKIKEIAKGLAFNVQNRLGYIETVLLRFRDGKPTISLVPRPEEVSRAGLSSAGIGDYVRTLLFGKVVSKLFTGEIEKDIRLVNDGLSMMPLEEIRKLPISIGKGKWTQLEKLVRFHFDKQDTNIYRLNKRRMVTISVKAKSQDSARVIDDLNKIIQEVKLSKTYSIEFSSHVQKARKGSKRILYLLVLTILLIFMMLAALFESFIKPLYIILTVPLGMMTIITVLFVAGIALDMTIYIGLILSAGIVVNNSILVVSSHSSKISGIGLSRLRGRAILMSTLSTVLGFLPLLFQTGDGSQLWHNLSLTICLNLLLSLLISLIVIPGLLPQKGFASSSTGG